LSAERTRRHRGPTWLRKSRAGCGCAIVIAALALVVLVSLVLPLSVLAFGPDLGALLYDSVILPMIRVESTLIDMTPTRRIGFFGLWLGFTFAIGLGLTRVLGRRSRRDSVPLVFLWSVVSVVTASVLSSWLMHAVLSAIGYPPSVE